MSSVLFDVPGPRAVRRYRVIGGLWILVLIVATALAVWKLHTENQFTARQWEPFVTPRLMITLLQGLGWTILAAVLAIIPAVIFGLFFGVGKLSDHFVVRWPSWLVVEFFRAVPLLMLIIFIWSLRGFRQGDLAALVFGLILYNGSVLAEIFRAGINAVPKGQAEAAYAIGMRKTQVMTIVQLPQAIKIMLPSIVSQCIVALKDTSLGFYVLAPGLTYAGRELWRTFNNYLAVAIVLGLIYIILNLMLSILANYLQRRYSSSGAGQVQLVAGQVQADSAGASSARP
ncbi:amino acid ABC transporter permease [Aeromicrobium sp. CTD01-1L150]|uniref:amino acid ABC transporter permease n=1 Tax=Aeromicrobium sp. CTD01-1L150 TaxID=3341830 RepID=UPI0035C1819C